MVSFIITHPDAKTCEEYARRFCAERNIHRFDITEFSLNNLLEAEKEKTSIGIADIKLILEKLYLKPLKSKEKAVIIHNADALTPEAQNALLKALEEPPKNTIILLTCESKENLLPTIRSRCSIIEIETKTAALTEEERAEFTDIVASLPTYSIGQSLKLAEVLAKNKNQARTWLEKSILAAREMLIEHTEKQAPEQADLLFLIKSLQESYVVIKTTNANLRLALENLFLSLSQ